MSRTYKCTKGNSKKLKPYFYQRNLYTWRDEKRNQDIDYNDGIDKEHALNLRKGYNQGVPKYFRRTLKKSENNKVRNFLHNCKKYEDYWDKNAYPDFREDAGWLWY
tara:strand:- start:200 stop:517 length:318 start_codon:yes stop_codon:yes gene_type:complete